MSKGEISLSPLVHTYERYQSRGGRGGRRGTYAQNRDIKTSPQHPKEGTFNNHGTSSKNMFRSFFLLWQIPPQSYGAIISSRSDHKTKPVARERRTFLSVFSIHQIPNERTNTFIIYLVLLRTFLSRTPNRYCFLSSPFSTAAETSNRTDILRLKCENQQIHTMNTINKKNLVYLLFWVAKYHCRL